MIKNYLILNCVVFSFLMISVKVFSQEKQKVISLYENKAPGSENWNYSETETKSKTFIYNISKPTLTVYKPDSKTANGIGVIVCPGGAFQFLSPAGSKGARPPVWCGA